MFLPLDRLEACASHYISMTEKELMLLSHLLEHV